MGLLKFLTSGVLGSVNSLAKTFVGDKSARETGFHQEQMSVQQGYQAEFLAPEKTGWFNQFVDGYNRLIRPFCTTGIIALIIWACVDPIEFSLTIQALALIPELMWYIIMTIIAFWFGGRILEKAPKSIKRQELQQIKETAKSVIEEREDYWKDKYLVSDERVSTNKVVSQWKTITKKPLPPIKHKADPIVVEEEYENDQ